MLYIKKYIYRFKSYTITVTANDPVQAKQRLKNHKDYKPEDKIIDIDVKELHE